MAFHLWGTDFRRPSERLRQQLYIPLQERSRKLESLKMIGFENLVYLHTCNRVEFYTQAPNHFCDLRNQWQKLLSYFDLPSEAYYQGYCLEGKAAIRHLMRVASSLESLVIGEPQILGQLKEACAWSLDHHLSTSPKFENAFQTAFETAKKIRSETGIGEKSVSVASLGLERMKRWEKEHPLQSAVIIGRGPMSLVTLRWILKHRPECRIYWVNRSVEKLEAFKEVESTVPLSLHHFLQNPPRFTHLFSATGSEEPIIRSTFLSTLTPGPKLLFDFAEPADIEEIVELPEIQVVRLPDLSVEAKNNEEKRTQAVFQAEGMIEQALKEYYQRQKANPLLRDFNAVEPLHLENLENALALLETIVPEEFLPKIHSWANKLVRLNLHKSRLHLREVLEKVATSPPTHQIPA